MDYETSEVETRPYLGAVDVVKLAARKPNKIFVEYIQATHTPEAAEVSNLDARRRVPVHGK